MQNEKNASLFLEQQQYILLLKEKLHEIYGDNPLAMISTYGCQQNVSDSEKIRGMLKEMGFGFTDSADAADFIIFNTCAVREHAEDRVFGNLGALKNQKRRKPSLTIAMCGCMAQQAHVAQRVKDSFPFVNILFGTQVIHRMPELMYRYFTEKKRVFDIGENSDIVEGVPLERDGGVKGWLPVMYGCNNFCSYCVVPYVRGRERSRSVEHILEDAKRLIDDGCRDITLLGQNVNSYNYNGTDFPKLLRLVNELDGDFRIRFMTSHPKDCSDELLYAMRDCDKVCRHLHLPFQSGSNEILRRMNRKYTKEHYLELVDKAKRIVPGITLTSDIIVGFPGETYEDFRQTLDVVKSVRFLSLYTFIFSKRKGTPAEKMDDPVPKEEKGRWFAELLRLQSQIAAEDEKNIAEKELCVLCEDAGRREGYMAGHTDTNICLEFEGGRDLLGKFIDVKTYLKNGEIIAKIKE